MNRPHQPFFQLAAVEFTRPARTIVAIGGALVVMVVAALFPPSPTSAAVLVACARIWFNAASIVLAAAPFVLAGAIGASVVERLRVRGLFALLAAALAPGCDCSMNGFAAALSRCPARFAGAALTWGSACNPIALATTAAVLGWHLAIARAAGGLVAALLVAVLWQDHSPVANLRENCSRACDGRSQTRWSGRVYSSGAIEHAERGLRVLLPAALAGATLPMAFGHMHVHATALAAAALASVLSPCSSADPVLAAVLTSGAPAQAAFMIASQCTDVRQLALMCGSFGWRAAALAAIAGACGCAVAALAAS